MSSPGRGSSPSITRTPVEALSTIVSGRTRASDADSLPGWAPECIKELFVERASARVVVAARSQFHGHCGDVALVETHVGGPRRPEAAHHQSRTDEQEQ